MPDQIISDNVAIEARAPISAGEILPPDDSYRFSPKLFPLASADSVESETIAALRNHLIGQHVRDGRRSLAICAPTRDVGSTFVSVNLAVAMAQSGVNTLLIDGNLRDPGLIDYITPATPTGGLGEYLQSPGNASPQVHAHVLPKLSLLYAGAQTVHAQELLATAQFKQLLDESLRTFDLTIVDCPPAANYSDARRIASLLRHALVVARRDHSYASDVKALVSELQADRVKVVGTFLNAFA